MFGLVKDSTARRVISTVLFIIYMGILVYFLFFAENMGRSVTRDYSMNLMPFKEIKRFLSSRNSLGSKAVWMNIAGNVAAFIPFGLFIIPVSGRNIRFLGAVVMTFNVSLCVEIIQLVTRVGSFDVDDLMLNTLGGVMGAGIYMLYTAIERKSSHGKA
ncbi:MAG: VanZ family protein [Butyrivibrio sp.]